MQKTSESRFLKDAIFPTYSGTAKASNSRTRQQRFSFFALSVQTLRYLLGTLNKLCRWQLI